MARVVVGFVGLGRMGSAMAANLVAAGHPVTAYVRRPEQRASLAAVGIHPVGSLDELCTCNIVVSMLPDDGAVTDVAFGAEGRRGLAQILAAESVHLSMGTISPRCATGLALEHARYGQAYVAAPVFGNPDAATARELYIIAAGPAEAVARCRILLEVMGQETFVVGADPAAANLIKLAGNVMTAATLEIMGEVLALAQKRGIDSQRLLTILTSTLFSSRVHRIYGGKIAAHRYEAGGFILPLALKDVRLALAEADAAAVPMPSVSLVRDRMLAGIARGYAHLDWSALGLIAAEDAGLNHQGVK